MKRILLIACILTVAGCAAEPGSEKWCAAPKEQPKIRVDRVRCQNVCQKLSDRWHGHWVSRVVRRPVRQDQGEVDSRRSQSLCQELRHITAREAEFGVPG